MKNRYLLTLCLVIIVILGGYIVYSISHIKPDAVIPGSNNPLACTEEAKLCPDGSAVGRTGPNCQFAVCPTSSFVWTFDRAASMDRPVSAVTLIVGEKEYPLGNFGGNCSTIDASSTWPLLIGEKSGVICYFAGAGTELGIFEENDNLVVKKGVLDEGDAETAGTRGNFQTLMILGGR